MASVPPKSNPCDLPPDKEFLEYIHPSLLSIDFDSWSVRAATIVFFLVLHLFSIAVSYLVIDFFWGHRLDLMKKCFLTSHLSKTFPLFIYSVAHCGYSTAFSNVLANDVVHGKTVSAVVFNLAIIGIYALDLAFSLAISYGFNTSTQNIITHHAMVYLGSIPVSYYDKGYFFCSTFLLLELPQPVFCIFTFAKSLGFRNSSLSRWNMQIGISVTHFRTTIECYCYWKFFINWNQVWHEMPISVWLGLLALFGSMTFYFTPLFCKLLSIHLYTPKMPESESPTVLPEKLSSNVQQAKTGSDQNNSEKEANVSSNGKEDINPTSTNDSASVAPRKRF